jgi:hypothetical protein
MRDTFSAENFEAHLRATAQNDAARESRRAERAHLLAEIPRLAAIEARLAKAVALTDDVETLVAELKGTQQQRKDAEARPGGSRAAAGNLG